MARQLKDSAKDSIFFGSSYTDRLFREAGVSRHGSSSIVPELGGRKRRGGGGGGGGGGEGLELAIQSHRAAFGKGGWESY